MGNAGSRAPETSVNLISVNICACRWPPNKTMSTHRMRGAMNTARIRLVGDEIRAETLMNMLHGVNGVERIEALPVLDAGWDRGAAENVVGTPDAMPAVCNLEVEVAGVRAAHRVRTFAAGAAVLMDATAEFVERF